jgi:hypothetical protein
MKTTFLLLSLVFSLNSFSQTENVGNKAVYDVNFQGIEAVTETVVTGVDRSSSEYNLKTTTTIQGQSEVTTEKVPSEDLMTREGARGILENCQFMGGRTERIHLAGALRTTCKLEATSDSVLPLVTKSGFQLTKETSGFVWIGAFPIHGIGKLETEELTMTLKQMNW